MSNELEVDVPHVLVAVTDKVPDVVGLNVTVLIELVAVPPPLYDQE